MRVFLFLCLLLATCSIHAAELAITMDDPNVEASPLFSPEEINQKILNALQNNGNLKATLFICGKRIDNPLGNKLVQAWDQMAHILGNHSYSHLSFDKLSEKELEQDALKSEALIKNYKNFRKIYRYPFLKEGDTAENRDDFRLFLRENGYVNGHVTIDASDWYINDRLEARLNENPKADISLFKKYYLEHIWDRAQYYDNLAKKVLGRSPKHILLLHHNLLNALFLDDLIKMFNAKGWKLINSDLAYQDEIYKSITTHLPAGESLIWALAKQGGQHDNELRYPAEDAVYEKEPMDKLGL